MITTVETNPAPVTAQQPMPLMEALHTLGVDRIPFKTKLCFGPLIAHIRRLEKSADFGESFLAKEILKRLQDVPELLSPIDDFDLVDSHREVIELMMATVLPPALRNTQLAKVTPPFQLNHCYLTTGFTELVEQHNVQYFINNFNEGMKNEMIVRACSLILNKFYGTNLHVEPLISFTVRPSDSNTERYFKAQLNFDYVDIEAMEPLQPISELAIHQLLSNIYDVDLWLYHLPPNNFEFHGFVITSLVDITEEEALSRMKFRLLSKEALASPENIEELEKLLKTYFALPDLHLGIVALDYPNEQMTGHKYQMNFHILNKEVDNVLDTTFSNSIYDKVCKYKSTLLIEDLKHYNPKTPLEKLLTKKGIGSIIVVPLLDSMENVIGFLEIASPRAYELHSFIELKLQEVVSLFTLAISRSREEMDNRIESVLREQFTAIHPSVEWKFMQASHNLIEKRDKGEAQARVEPIVFKDLYPLYGQSDIVGSSTKRNAAIQTDMLDNLARVQTTLERCYEISCYPLVSQLMMRVNQTSHRLQEEFSSNDETAVVTLLQGEIHPLLRHLRKQYPDLELVIGSYFSYLDKDLGVVYRERKAFEESVAMLNNAISNYLSREQINLQQQLPHYFEKYQTDGVEFEMYVGQSLLQQSEFSTHHLHNFRLWQLIAMCHITRRVDSLQDTLPVPLRTAQLIFAYTTPLSIRFRMDEKQFDVDGAYNVRYEILKKRIDKAVIEGTDERLTVSGKIAVVYLQDKDRQEYLEYFDYLKHEEFITDEVEDLELGSLQGAQGLRAVRVTVKLD